MRGVFCGLLLQLLLISLAAAGQPIDAERHTAIWLWSGVEPQPVMKTVERIYVFQGEYIVSPQENRLLALGARPSKMPNSSVWLVFRFESIALSGSEIESMGKAMTTAIQRWEGADTAIQGIQIDFDARTYALAEYSDFLQILRRGVPGQYKLSITGLLDWASTGNISVLNNLAGTVDEIVIQTYQGRETVPDYGGYLSSLSRLSLPFRIGLIQGGEWDREWERRLEDNPAYQGCVVFMVNRH